MGHSKVICARYLLLGPITSHEGSSSFVQYVNRLARFVTFDLQLDSNNTSLTITVFLTFHIESFFMV